MTDHFLSTAYGRDVLQWQEFWDMFVAAIHKVGYTAVDTLNYLDTH